MTSRNKIILAVLVILTAFAFGRFSAPEKIKIETNTVEVEKKTDDTKTTLDKDKHLETTTVVITGPSGITQTTTHTVEDDKSHKNSDSKETDQIQLTETTSKEVTRGASPVTVSAIMELPLSLKAVTPTYGLSVYKPMIGPIGMGAGAFMNGNVQLSVGLSF